MGGKEEEEISTQVRKGPQRKKKGGYTSSIEILGTDIDDTVVIDPQATLVTINELPKFIPKRRGGKRTRG